MSIMVGLQCSGVLDYCSLLKACASREVLVSVSEERSQKLQMKNLFDEKIEKFVYAYISEPWLYLAEHFFGQSWREGRERGDGVGLQVVLYKLSVIEKKIGV